MARLLFIEEEGRYRADWIPAYAGMTGHSGVDGTNWVVIDKATYDACLDHADYR